MYTPPHNRETDPAKILAFMREYPFATLVTTREGKLTATHLPVLVDNIAPPEPEGSGVRSLQPQGIMVVAHIARGNTQWLDFGSGDAMVIFQEPHAFISTRHYERALSVPTWNYVAVHAYGLP